MSKLDKKTRVQIIRLLVEGNSIRATARIVDVSKNTVTKLPNDAGDTWTWTAIDSDSKLIVSYMVGGRDSE